MSEEARESGLWGHQSGDIIDKRFELNAIVGRGGMGVVWRAHDIALDIDVALKLLNGKVLGPDGRRRLLIEARAAAAIAHPSIVTVHSLGTTEEHDPYVIMELLDGETLEELLDREGRLEPDWAVRTILPIIDALAIAHDRGIIHRDIKSANILVVPENDAHWRPKLLDFGIARIVDDEVTERLTVTGHVMGTPQFMSPEQAAGRNDVDHRTDIWGISAVLYELLTGFAPFDGENYNAVISAVLLEEPAPFPDDLALDDELCAIVERGLCKSRQRRWSSMRELRRALERWLLRAGIDTDVTGRRLSTPDVTGPQPLLSEEDAHAVAVHAVLDASRKSDPTILGLGLTPPRPQLRSTQPDTVLAEPLILPPAPPEPVHPRWRRNGLLTAAALLCAVPLWLFVPSAIPSASATPPANHHHDTERRAAPHQTLRIAPTPAPEAVASAAHPTAAGSTPSTPASASASATPAATAAAGSAPSAPAGGWPTRGRHSKGKQAARHVRGPTGFDMPLPSAPAF